LFFKIDRGVEEGLLVELEGEGMTDPSKDLLLGLEVGVEVRGLSMAEVELMMFIPSLHPHPILKEE